MKAHARALDQVIEANVCWSDEGLRRYKQVDIGIAVSVPGGLITPVVRAAEQKRISTLSTEIRELAMRARDKGLSSAEYHGGTSAISNLGMFGVERFAAIINPPNSSILAVGATRHAVVAVGGDPDVQPVMDVTLSVDHRAIDGALAAELLAAFKWHVENPLSLLT